MLREPGEGWSTARLADRAAVSWTTLIRRFGQATRMPVGTFLTRLRMMIAAALLTRGDAPVGTTAGAVGYRSDGGWSGRLSLGLRLQPRLPRGDRDHTGQLHSAARTRRQEVPAGEPAP
ncbi:helix-turn-helix domain-containing protein [Streptomyces sp. NPDC056503]|uniref:helix-turn-helix domain-containing protein n=1 Tax=Streptomyces sp. NPDC056503 TaxID=3345842 RepID=UPI0036A5ADFB